jgi:hypothetical protein
VELGRREGVEAGEQEGTDKGGSCSGEVAVDGDCARSEAAGDGEEEIEGAILKVV